MWCIYVYIIVRYEDFSTPQIVCNKLMKFIFDKDTVGYENAKLKVIDNVYNMCE